MKQTNRRTSLAVSAIGILCLILDSKNASASTANAIELCLKTVIPSLFPMFVLSGLVVSGISGASGGWISSLESLIRLPTGSGSIFLMGVLGGFPIGAQCIGQAVSENRLSRQDGVRMLGFCSNCSPAFLFGILGSMFRSASVPFLIWIIQLESALLIAAFWPGQAAKADPSEATAISLSDAVLRSIRSMANVCAWVILSAVATGFLERWLFPILPSPLPELLRGLLELTGGILGTGAIESENLRMLLCTLFVCFGGICVLLQIQSIAAAHNLSMKTCIQQKIAHGLLGLLLTAALIHIGPYFLFFPLIPIIAGKIMVEKAGTTMYNSSHKGGY